jgi:hypothetical protein
MQMYNMCVSCNQELYAPGRRRVHDAVRTHITLQREDVTFMVDMDDAVTTVIVTMHRRVIVTLLRTIGELC